MTTLQRIDTMKYWILSALACGLCLINIWHTWYDVRTYGGTDLRVRVVGARALLRGINPYKIKDSKDLDPALRDPDQEVLSRCTYHPTLLLFYAPFAALSYPAQRMIWAALEWSALGGSVALLSFCLKSNNLRFWFCVAAVGLFGGAPFWRLHVERGQYYIFVVLLISVGMLLLLRTKSSIAAGIAFGFAICLRPTAICFVLPLLAGTERKAGVTAIVTAGLAVMAATVAGKFEYWLDFVQLSRTWELSLLSGVMDGNIDPEVHSRPTDGYKTAIMDGYAANLTFVSLAKSVQTIFQVHLDPIIIGRIGKGVWIIFITAIWSLHLRARRQQSERVLYQLLAGTCLMIVTDYFLPIRVEYADVMFLLPLAILMPFLRHKEYRSLTILATASILISMLPLNSLPFNASAVSAMLRSSVVLYLIVRLTVIGFPASREFPQSSLAS